MNGMIKMAALAALLTSAAAFANEDPSQAQTPATTPGDTSMATDTQWPEFTTLDTNGDGYVSQEEAAANASLAAKFSELDTDKNGALSSSEYRKGRDMAKSGDQTEETPQQ